MKKDYHNRWKSRRQENWKRLQKAKSQLKKGPFDRFLSEAGAVWEEKIPCTECGACCRAPGPLLRERDILLLARELKMKPRAFTETYLRLDEEGDYVFQNLPCPFWEESTGLCFVYSVRPGACRNFPNLSERNQQGRLKELFADSLICPQVSRTLEELLESVEKNG